MSDGRVTAQPAAPAATVPGPRRPEQVEVGADLAACTAQTSMFRATFDAMEGRICLLAGDGTVIETNRAWAELATEAGWAPGGSLFAYVTSLPTDLGDALAEAVSAVLTGQQVREVKGELPLPTRTERVVIRLRRIDGHEQARVVVSLIDITDPGRVTDEARMLALVARHTDNAVVIMDAQGRIEWVNEAFSRMTGYSAEEAVGCSRTDLLARELTASPTFVPFAQALRMGTRADLEVPLHSRDGRSYWAQMELLPIVEKGSMSGRFVCIERDVTARRHAEEQLRAATRQARLLADEVEAEKTLLGEVLGAIPHLVYWKDSELRYAGVNPAYLGLRGLTENGVLGRTERELGHRDDLTDILLDAETAVLLSGQPRENQRVMISSAQNGWRTLLLSVLPHLGGNGSITGVIGVAADVTQLSALEQQLAQASRLESIGQLAAGIAHEINTPVQYVSDNIGFVVGSFGEALDALTQARDALATTPAAAQQAADAIAAVDLDFLAEEIPSALSQSQEGLDRVAQIVRAMKDFSHPGQGRSEADLNQAVRTTVQVCRNEWRYVAEVDLDLSDEVGLVACYEGELKQVLLNIVVNAAQAIEEQRDRGERDTMGTITISTRRHPGLVRIIITDDGPGMDEDVRRRVFDPFFTTKPVGKGTGQGLSMAYAVIVQKHAGHLAVSSTPGRGARFMMDLPDSPTTGAGSKDGG